MGKPDTLAYNLLALGSPLLFFFIGVVIADRAALYEHITRREMYPTAIPTGVLITGMLTSGTAPMIDDVPNYGHMQHLHKFLLFAGTVMFYGVASPELFGALKTKVLRARGAPTSE